MVHAILDRNIVKYLNFPRSYGSNKMSTLSFVCSGIKQITQTTNISGSTISKQITFEIRIYDPFIRLAFVGIGYNLKGNCTNELIIAIKKDLHIVWLTISECSIYNVESREFPLFILYISDSLLWEFIRFHVLYCHFHVGIRWVVVNENNMIILILLLNNGSHCFHISTLINVIVAEHSYA